jgi:hypothetical protein
MNMSITIQVKLNRPVSRKHRLVRRNLRSQRALLDKRARDKSVQIPVVNVSEMKLFQGILKAILDNEKADQTHSKTKDS